MASTVMGEKVDYKIDDAVAYMPLIVGLHRVGSYDLGLFEPLCRYRPPKADIMRQSWGLRNSKTYGVVRAAVRKCNSGALFALSADAKDKKFPARGNSIAEVTTKDNHFHSVIQRAKYIESMIMAELSASLNKIKANASTVRTSAMKELRYKIEMFDDDYAYNVAFDFLKKNSDANEVQMKNIFGFTGVNSPAWAGLNLFMNFWNSNVKAAPAEDSYKTKVEAQEEFSINSFLEIITAYHNAYNSLILNLPVKLQENIQTAYFKGDHAFNDNRKDSKIKELADVVDKYLWNVIYERLEILDSIVHTYFSMCCTSKSAHIPLAKKFMENAILYCLAPIFSAVPAPPTKYRSSVQGEDVSEQKRKDDNDRAEIHEFFNRHTNEFKSALDIMFPTGGGDESKGLKSVLTPLNADDRSKIKNRLSQHLLIASNGNRKFVGPKAGEDEKTEHFLRIEKFVVGLLDTVSQMKLEDKVGKANIIHNDEIIRIHRSKGMKLDILQIINASLKPNTECLKQVKKIVYQNIYFDSVSYAAYHYKSFDSSITLQDSYFARISHPFSVSATQRIKGTEDAEKLYAGKGKEISRVMYSTVDPSTKKLNNITDDKLAIMVLKKEFHPNVSTAQQGNPQAGKGTGKKKTRKDRKKKGEGVVKSNGGITKKQKSTQPKRGGKKPGKK